MFTIPVPKPLRLSYNWMTNRNGTPDIIAVEVWDYLESVTITGRGVSGRSLTGGVHIEDTVMDALCTRWLLERGYSVQKGVTDVSIV
jgi:hypothetical protein